MAGVNIDTFMGFVQAAKGGASGEKSVVHISDDNKLSTNAWQKLGKRQGDFKARNLETRQHLLDVLSDEFGGVDKLPAGVKKALNLDAFKLKNGMVTSSRPLTARRIEKISAAVEAARSMRTAETEVADAVVSRVMALLKKPSLSNGQRKMLTEKFGTTPSAIKRAFSAMVKTKSALSTVMDFHTMTKSQMDELQSIIRSETGKTFEKALKEGDAPLGFAGDCLRTCGAEGMFGHTTINGRHVAMNVPYDEAIFKNVEFKGGFSPAEVDDIKSGQKRPNPNAAFLSKLVTLVPKDDPNCDAITRMITSQMGTQGLVGDLSSKDFHDKDCGFGKMISLMSGIGDDDDDLGFSSGGSFAPNPVDFGFRDVSLDGNSIVLTQRTHFGPQITTLDGVNLCPLKERALDVPVYNVTKTIRIPLNQAKVGPGNLPQYTCEVEVSPFAEEAVKKQLQKSPCGFGKPITLTLKDEGDYLRKTIMTMGDPKNPSLESLEFNDELKLNDASKNFDMILKYTIGEFDRRQQEFEIGGEVYSKKTKDVDAFKTALKDAFTVLDSKIGGGEMDWRGLKLFERILLKGLGYPDSEREMMGGKLTFPFALGMRKHGSENRNVLKSLGNGHYALTFWHKWTGPELLEKINNDGTTTTYFAKNKKLSPDDSYEYSYSLEFYVDEDNRAHVTVLQDPQVTWQFGDHFEEE